MLEYKSFTVVTVLLVLFGTATSFFEFQAVLSQPDHLDTEQDKNHLVDLINRKGKPATWYLGKGLGLSQVFTYKVCDMTLIVPESPDHCYQIRLEFIDILKGPHGDVWIVQAVMDHQDKKTYAIFQISATTFDITTDRTSIPYADSVSRTIFWIGKFANEFDQKPLTIGKSWGKVATHTAPETELIIRNSEVIGLGNNEQQFQTFILGYNLIEQSTLSISDDFPFPIKAVIYKPIISHQNIPLQFTIELVDYKRSDFLYDSSLQTIPNENEFSESLNDFDDVLLNETVVDENANIDHSTDSNEPNATTSFEENNSNSTGANYFDAINLEKLFEMFLNEHFDDDSDEQILNYTVFLDFLNETNSAIIEDNFTEP
ncbi:conserved hypothetical protein [Candidatus Nitrosotenuis uzonensis]|uniref:Uncharacterized protein n=1 Tax=Candidatus Nitrosotenuis uzonensis TaxID=1407055 RepID=A0A812F0F7_9ARCH|nr:conserved hypothetical protein [Candidatus Nitrosotenuis uzonensis]